VDLAKGAGIKPVKLVSAGLAALDKPCLAKNGEVLRHRGV
jgi:hypothetical protein